MLDLSGNALLAIVVRSLGLANIFVDNELPVLSDRSHMIAFNRRILQAIEVGDAARAAAISRSKFEVMQQSSGSYREVA